MGRVESTIRETIMNHKRYTLFLVPLILMLLAALGNSGFAQDSLSPSGDIPVLVTEVIATYPHDVGAYTQGLLLFDGSFYESTGASPGDTLSTLREVNPQTGEVIRSFTLEPQDPAIEIFAEGLAKVDDRLIQLTWQTNVAIVYDFATFDIVGQFFYEGEGWGLCYDGESLYMSDGSPYLYQRDPNTFTILNAYRVTILDIPISRINELECVGDFVYANVWFSDTILQIDKHTGQVVALIDAENLLTPEERQAIEERESGAVLNGIAYNAETDTFFITGKLWDTMYEVRFVDK
jgi:glutaminyl-peptide cyclotransferase